VSHAVITLSAVARSVVPVMDVMPPDLPTRRRPSKFAALVLSVSFLMYVVLLLTLFTLKPGELIVPFPRWDLRPPRSKIGLAFIFQMIRPSRRRAKMLLSPTSWKSYFSLKELAQMKHRALPEQINLTTHL